MVMATEDATGRDCPGSFTTINGVYAYAWARGTRKGAHCHWAANLKIRQHGVDSADCETAGGKSTDLPMLYSSWRTGNFEGTSPLIQRPEHNGRQRLPRRTPTIFSWWSALQRKAMTSTAPGLRFPDTNPRVRWQHVWRRTIAPSTVNTGPDSYGWTMTGCRINPFCMVRSSRRQLYRVFTSCV